MPDKPFDSQPLDNPNALRAASGSPWLWASTPALALAALAWALRGAALPLPVGVTLPFNASAIASGADLVVPASETLVVARRSTSAVLLRGRLQPPAGTPLFAPGGGQISQVLARPGQMVHAGQALMEISRGVSAAREGSGPPPGIMRAERDQTVAEHQGEAAQQKVTLAHMRLAAAQTRVQAAQERVARARDLVNRLQNGEDVGRDDLSTPTPAPTPAPEKTRPQKTLSASASAAATRDSRRAQKLADDAEAQAASARRAAQAAEENARAKKILADKAQSALDDLRAQAKNDSAKSDSAKSDSNKSDSDSKDKKDDKNSGAADSTSSSAGKSDDASTPHASTHSGSTHVVGLRAAQRRAEGAQASWQSAQSRAESERADSDKAQSRAKLLRGQSNDAVREAASALQNLHVFAGENSGPTLRDTASTPDANSHSRQARASHSSGEKITALEASRIAREAVSESEAAVLNAERIQREVAELERPVGKTARRVESSKKSFESAQQQMWSAPRGYTRANVTPVTAPAAGVLLWIAEPARDVQSGEPLGAVGRADRLQVVLRDTSNAWKTTRVGATVMALVQAESWNQGAQAQPQPAMMNNQQPAQQPVHARNASTQDTASSTENSLRGVPTLARVLAVAPPARAGAPALITVAIHNPRHASTLVAPENAANRPDTNYGLAARVFEPGTQVVCSLAQPSAGAQQIVVPAASVRRDADRQAIVAVLTPVENQSANGTARSAMCRIEWRKVQLGSGDGFQNVVLSGLQSGDRIALRPAALYTFTLAHGAAAILRVEQA